MPLIDRFQNEADVFIFLISTLAGGTGLNLTAANRVVVFGTVNFSWTRVFSTHPLVDADPNWSTHVYFTQAKSSVDKRSNHRSGARFASDRSRVPLRTDARRFRLQATWGWVHRRTHLCAPGLQATADGHRLHRECANPLFRGRPWGQEKARRTFRAEEHLHFTRKLVNENGGEGHLLLLLFGC
jgi:hypothetical protein